MSNNTRHPKDDQTTGNGDAASRSAPKTENSTVGEPFNPLLFSAGLKKVLDTIPDQDQAKAVYRGAMEALRQQFKVESVQDGVTWDGMAAAVSPIVWEWPGWMARGIVSILASEPGMGKSATLLRVAGCYLNGLPWPDGSAFTGTRGTVLWCEAEAGQAIHLERAKAWGFPLEKILTPLPDPLADIFLDDPQHQAAISHMARRDDVQLIVVDSLSGANRREENSADMRAIGKWLAELSRDINKPLSVSHHLRKRGLLDGGDKVTLDRLRGSTTIAQFARVIWAFDAPDPTDVQHKRLSVIKSNLAKIPPEVGVRIAEDGVEFDTAPEAPKTETLQDKAGAFLKDLLASGPVDAEEVEVQVKGAGLSWNAANRAKAKMGIVSAKEGTSWKWSLPYRGEIIN